MWISAAEDHAVSPELCVTGLYGNRRREVSRLTGEGQQDWEGSLMMDSTVALKPRGVAREKTKAGCEDEGWRSEDLPWCVQPLIRELP